ncbi:hypothetical protein [Henriciella aquimarina]|uniref:hypothetical protein n=1 Tax=Henriciella aquimarina TaxID=545261 RepID=UPI001179D5B3|nr:hypothetical protein [Henriciella aquimarina]
MSKRNRLGLLASAFFLFAAPAMADGYANTSVQRGPGPLEAQAAPPAENCELMGGDWYCPPQPTETLRPEKPEVRYVERSCCRPAPAEAEGLVIDVSGFDGGVGSGVSGNFHPVGGRRVLLRRPERPRRVFPSPGRRP